MESTESPSVVRRFSLVVFVLPLVVTAAALALQMAWWGDLPQPVATHWGTSSQPDGFGSAWTYPAITVGLGLGVPLLVALSTLPMLRRGARGATFRFMGAFAFGMSVFAATLSTWLVSVQRGLASATDARLDAVAIVAPLVMGVVAGTAAWFLQPRQEAVIRDWEPSEAIGLEPGERAVWMRTVTMARWGIILLGTIAAGLAVGAAASWAVGQLAGAWYLLGSLAIVALSVAAVAVFHVRVDADGLTVVAALGFPRLRVALDDVGQVGVAPVHGFAEFGGYGVRVRPGATGIVLRNGDALQVTRKDGRRVVVTVDDAASAAALLSALAARAAPNKGA